MTRLLLLVGAIVGVAGAPGTSHAVTITAGGQTLLHDDFESPGLPDPPDSDPDNELLPGDWVEVEEASDSWIQVLDATTQSPYVSSASFEGDNYLKLYRNTGGTWVSGALSTNTAAYDVHAEWMTHIPSAQVGSPTAIAVFALTDQPGSGWVGRTWVAAWSDGRVYYSDGTWYDSGLRWTPDVWERWEVDYVPDPYPPVEGTYTVSVSGATSGVLPQVPGSGGHIVTRFVAAAATDGAVFSIDATEGEAGIFESTGSDVVSRYFHAGSMLPHGLVMISGGLGMTYVMGIPTSLFSRDDISFYDPATGTFSDQFDPLNGAPVTTPSLLTARSSHTQTTLPDGRVLIAGGRTGASGTSPGSATAAVELFDSQTGTVYAASSMAIARADHTATLMPDGRVVVAGGASWQVFSPCNDTWSASYALARARTAHAAVLLPDYAGTRADHRLLLIGGGGSGPDTMELLDPADGTTALLSSTLPVGVDDLNAVLLGDGRVFIVGGQDNATGDTVPYTMLLDPVWDTIAAGPDVPNRTGGIADHQLVRFGRYVGVFGGEQEVSGTDTALDYAAIFDSWTDTWYDVDAMIDVHDDFVAVPLSGYSVLLADGGVPLPVLGVEVPSMNCEVFTLTMDAECRDADLDIDGDVDSDDYARFFQCLTGP